MKQFRIKAQALTLVLIVVVVSIVIAFSITSRVLEDIKQQGEERASTRAEAFAESAVENLTQKIQTGELTPQPNQPVVKYAISTQNPSGLAGTLDLCDPNSIEVSKQCDPNSVAQITYFNMIVQFKVFNSENIEVQMTPLSSTAPVKSDTSKMLIHLRTAGNTTFNVNTSKILVKGFARTKNASAESEVKTVSECIVNLNDLTSNCLPNYYLKVTSGVCPEVTINLTQDAATGAGKVTNKLGDKCFYIQNVDNYGSGVSFYRIKPLLNETSTSIPYIDISATGTSDPITPAGTATLGAFELPVPQMAAISAGVYSGTSSNNQQVFQQSTRLILLNKAVPEIADYVLYNGSADPIVKQ